MATTFVESPESRCLVGLARRDVTPPVGIYHRMWGAATHDRSTGVHRPLTATALFLAPLDRADAGRGFIALDHCLLFKPEADTLLDAIGRAGVSRDRLTIFFSHTHAAGLMDPGRADLPGGELIPGYFATLGETIAAAVAEARSNAFPATITFGNGRCSLARNRDYFDSDGKAICGFNPDGVADDTVLVGRITGDDGRTLGTIVNYACHPTTLAWENTLISPDYVGAMREVVETTAGGLCFFIQGASGDIGPRHGYVGDVAIAEKNGRQLGHAVLSALEELPPPGMRFHYTGPVVSGATLGRWDYQPRTDRLAPWREQLVEVQLPYRRDLKRVEEVQAEDRRWRAEESAARAAGDAIRAQHARAMIERATRYLTRVRHLPPGDHFPFRTTLTRIGDAIWVPLDGEHYNVLQRRLRERFPDRAIIVGTIANGSNIWYLPDADSYGKGLYQDEVAVVERGSLEQLSESLAGAIRRLTYPAGR